MKVKKKSIRAEADLGEKIKVARRQMDLKQYELAEKTGLSANYISLIESGKKSPSLKNLYKIAEALNTNVSWLLKNDPVVNNIKELATLYDMEWIAEALHRLYLQGLKKTK
jgi:transcriptional regulator with XRE-family HTH domain